MRTEMRCAQGLATTCAFMIALLVGCGQAYKSPVLLQDRILCRESIPADDFDVYSAALPSLLPGDRASRDWITVTGVTVPAEGIDLSLFAQSHRDVAQALAHRLRMASDTVYVIDGRFAESLAVVVAPLMDTTEWVPIRWHRTMHRSYPGGILSLSRVAQDAADGERWAMVYGLYGKGPIGTGFPSVLLLRRDGLDWVVVESHSLEE